MKRKALVRRLVGALFIVAGLNHFRRPEMYLAIMPDYLPWHRQLVALSGYAELIGGCAMLVPRLATAAGWGLVALLVAVFPANLHMALNPERFQPIPHWVLWARLPLQPVLIGVVLWCTRQERSDPLTDANTNQ